MRLIDADKLLKDLKESELTTFSQVIDFIFNYELDNENEKEIEQLKAWKNDVMESLCKYDANSVEEVYERGVKAGTKIIDVMEKGEAHDTIIMKDNGRVYKIKCME